MPGGPAGCAASMGALSLSMCRYVSRSLCSAAVRTPTLHSCASVRAELLHGEENAPYLLRSDHRLLGIGRAAAAKQNAATSSAPLTITEALEVPFVWNERRRQRLLSGRMEAPDRRRMCGSAPDVR